MGKFIGFFELLSTVLLSIMSSVLFVQVFFRYVLHSSLFWAEELARYSMVWVVFLGAVVAVSRGTHTKVDYFVSKLPMKIQMLLEIFKNILCASFTGVITYYGIKVYKVAMMSRSSGLLLPMGWVYGIVPFTAAIMTVVFLKQAFISTFASFAGGRRI